MKRIRLDDSTDLGRQARSNLAPETMPPHQQSFGFFRFDELPFSPGKHRSIAALGSTDLLSANIQTIADDSVTGLHFHGGMDGIRFILTGRAVFWGEDKVEREFGPLEGMIIPRGVPYGFRKIGDEPLVLLQVEAIDPRSETNMFKALDDSGNRRMQSMDDWVDFYDARVSR